MKKDDFIKWWYKQKQKCFYCGQTIEEIMSSKDRFNKRVRRLTIDRVRNDKGYRLDNIILSCNRCNIIKGDFFTLQEMIKIGKIVATKYKKVKKE